MNYRPSRSMVRRLSPLAVLIIGIIGFFGHMAMASATTPVGNTNPACQSYPGFATWNFAVNNKVINLVGTRDALNGKVNPGDTVTFSFTLKPACDNLYVGLDSYKSNGPAVLADGNVNLSQTLFQRDAKVFRADGTVHTLQVVAPNCYFQLDAYTGSTFKVGDFSNSGGPGFITSAWGGSSTNCATTTTTGAPIKPPTTTTVKPTTTTVKPTTTTVKPTTTTVKPTTTTVKPTTTTVKPTTTTVKPTTTTTVKPTTTTTTPPVVISNAASISQVCKVGSTGWNVTFNNNGNQTQSFVLSGKDEAGTVKVIDTVSVSAGKSVTKSYSFDDNKLAAGKSLDLTVVVGTKQLAAEKITNNCINVAVDVAATCSITPAGATLVFTNNGKVDETFTVLDSNGKALAFSPVAVKAGESVTKTQVVSDHAQTDFEIKGAVSKIDVTKSVTTNCAQVLPVVITPTTLAPTTTTAPQVLAETVTRPALAFTGFNVTPLIIGATVMLILGAALILGGRRRAASDTIS